MNTSPASTRSAENAEKLADKSVASSLDASINNQDDEQDSLSKSVHKEDIAAGQLPAQGLEHYLQEQERRLIITALKQTNWNKTQAAELLGTTFRSLRYRMTKLEIAEDQSES
ncbi:helix-turn-helix domain-containing protein [uncultured Psychrobacter sp.]|uniref:helix-turn-helix domain-containing protein n=1 Tax=uncultured Psychrobacter sp. TaxID=259303 RepID=UPI0026215C28|nr:helix-turn-helix domain-containing protein [uncultured Psychrobacter sp.]